MAHVGGILGLRMVTLYPGFGVICPEYYDSKDSSQLKLQHIHPTPKPL